MTFQEWYREWLKIIPRGTLNKWMAMAWNAALEEAIDEIRAHITVDNQDRLNKAINNLIELKTEN